MDTNSVERERFESIFRAHHGSVRGYVGRRVAAGEVDDIVSEIFLTAWRRLDDVPEDPLPWLLGVARNTVGTARRGATRRMRLHDRARADVDDSHVVAGPEQIIERGLASAALGRLNAGDREAITLIAWEGLTPTQAAAALGIPPNRFRVRLHRASRRLRWALQTDADEAAQSERHDFGITHPSEGALS